MRWFTRPRPRTNGFTLVEVLATLAILMVLLVVLIEFLTDIDHAWKSAASDPFVEAADAFETMSQHLAGATLEPYRDYADATGAFRAGASFVPDHLAQRSDLAFVCGPSAGASGLLTSSGLVTTGDSLFFVAPSGYTQSTGLAHQGATGLLNAMGYYVDYGDDPATPAFFLGLEHTYRWRLKQIEQPSEALQIFATTTSTAWIQKAVPVGSAMPVLAANIVTLVVLPERAASDTGAALASAFAYDSRNAVNTTTLNQLPPRVRLVLVAMDAESGRRLAALNGATAPVLVSGSLFQQATQLDADLATLDAKLTTQKIGHRIFQRVISLPASTWFNATAASP